MVCWGVLPSIAEGLVVGVFTTMLFTCLTFATVERFRTFLMAAKKSKLEKWLHWIVYSECISGLLMNFTGAAANWVTISSPEDERVSCVV